MRRRRRTWVILKWVAIALVILYVIGIAMVCFFPDRFVLFPSREPISVKGATRKLIEAPSGSLEIWIEQNSAARVHGPAAYVLAFNGNGSRAENELGRILPMWDGHPIEIWAVNYPGYGGSAGAALLRNIPPAALAAYDALARQAGGKPIFVSGHSLGTAAALYVAVSRPVAGLVLHNPPPLRKLIAGRFGWFNFWVASSRVAADVPQAMNSLANGAHCHAPAVFLLAGKDTLVTPPYQKLVVHAFAGPKRLVPMPNYGHNTPVLTQPALSHARSAINWLWNTARVGAPKPATRRHLSASAPSTK